MKYDTSELHTEIKKLWAENKRLRKQDQHREKIWKKRVADLEAQRDAANAVAKAYVEQVDELEQEAADGFDQLAISERKIAAVETEIDAMEIFEGNASRDCCCDEAVQWYAARLRSLLKENE